MVGSLSAIGLSHDWCRGKCSPGGLGIELSIRTKQETDQDHPQLSCPQCHALARACTLIEVYEGETPRSGPRKFAQRWGKAELDLKWKAFSTRLIGGLRFDLIHFDNMLSTHFDICSFHCSTSLQAISYYRRRTLYQQLCQRFSQIRDRLPNHKKEGVFRFCSSLSIELSGKQISTDVPDTKAKDDKWKILYNFQGIRGRVLVEMIPL